MLLLLFLLFCLSSASFFYNSIYFASIVISLSSLLCLHCAQQFSPLVTVASLLPIVGVADLPPLEYGVPIGLYYLNFSTETLIHFLPLIDGNFPEIICLLSNSNPTQLGQFRFRLINI